MKIMITGGLGFIGSHLVEFLLKENHELFVISKNNSKLKNVENVISDIAIKYLDVTDFDALGKYMDEIKPEVIIHLAGETSHSKSFENPLYDVDINAKSTLFMLEKIKNMKSSCRFILGSTFVVVGRPQELPINENTPCNPTTIYGTDRLASEHYCEIYHQVYNLDTVWFRITNSFGPREQTIAKKNAVNFLIFTSFKGDKVTIYNNGEFFRDLIYVSDVISAINIIMNKGKSGNLYWISSFEKTWFYQIGKWLNEFTNAPIKYIEPPDYTKKVDVGNFLVDNSKLKSLGWEINTPIKEGIKKTIDYFKKRNTEQE